MYRATGRDAQSTLVQHQRVRLTDEQRELPLEQIFDGRFTQAGSDRVRHRPAVAGRLVRRATTGSSAGFLMAEVPLGARLKLIGGARYESDQLDVDAPRRSARRSRRPSSGTTGFRRCAATLKLTDAQQLRLSASRTLARPEYRELSPIISRDVIGGENVQGDENLQRTNVTNLDLRWEMYPSRR